LVVRLEGAEAVARGDRREPRDGGAPKTESPEGATEHHCLKQNSQDFRIFRMALSIVVALRAGARNPDPWRLCVLA